MNKYLLILALVSTSVLAAGGGKVNNPWQPVDPNQDVCTAFLPAGLNLEDCTELAETEQSGAAYLCSVLDQFIVVCPESVD